MWSRITVWTPVLTGVGTYPTAINSAVLANLRHKEGLDPTFPGWILLVPVSHKPSRLCTFPPAAESPCCSQTLCLSLGPAQAWPPSSVCLQANAFQHACKRRVKQAAVTDNQCCLQHHSYERLCLSHTVHTPRHAHKHSLTASLGAASCSLQGRRSSSLLSPGPLSSGRGDASTTISMRNCVKMWCTEVGDNRKSSWEHVRNKMNTKGERD